VKVVSSKPIFNAGTERFIRDWRSGIVTVTVRDQRMRQHDPILGVVPLKLSEILQTSSQVTRWYPLDGGIGFGRIRISLLFRSVETRLPLNQLGWDVGTFEFTSNKILALNYYSNTKLKLRTGGSSGSIPRTQCKQLSKGDSYRHRCCTVEYDAAGMIEAYGLPFMHWFLDEIAAGRVNTRQSVDRWAADYALNQDANFATFKAQAKDDQEHDALASLMSSIAA
jgi:hypothetical protein